MTKCTHCDATVLSSAETKTKVPVLVPDRNSASGNRVEWLSIEIDSDLAAALAAAPGEASWRSGATPAIGGADDAICYIERWKVRGIIIGHNAATQAVLPQVDALPIFTTEDFRTSAALAATPAVGGEREALASLLTIIDELDQYQKRPERGDYGVECACCMGELFDTDDRVKIEAARAFAAQPASPLQGREPTVDEVRQTIADEWGSHVCYYDATYGYPRNCDQDKHCRCADIARAVLNQHSLASPPEQPAAAPVTWQCNRPHLGLATTRELLDELRARFEIHAAGGLDYRTIDGEALATRLPATAAPDQETT